jgi:hypothetical protein
MEVNVMRKLNSGMMERNSLNRSHLSNTVLFSVAYKYKGKANLGGRIILKWHGVKIFNDFVLL